MLYWKKLMVYNGILMETIGISVVVSIVVFSRVGVVWFTTPHAEG